MTPEVLGSFRTLSRWARTKACSTRRASSESRLPIGAGARFVHSKRSSLHVGSVQRLDGGFGFPGIRHLHEAESAGLVGMSVDDDAGGVDPPEPLERLPQVRFV